MARLRSFNGSLTLPENVDLVLIVSDAVSSPMQEVARRKCGAIVHKCSEFGDEYAMARPIGEHSEYYADCFQKFLVFLLPTNVYKRVIAIDADCLIMRAPHHLFLLPDEIPLAAPQAYWYWQKPKYQDTAFWKDETLRNSRQDFLTTWLMSVSVSGNSAPLDHPRQYIEGSQPNPRPLKTNHTYT